MRTPLCGLFAPPGDAATLDAGIHVHRQQPLFGCEEVAHRVDGGDVRSDGSRAARGQADAGLRCASRAVLVPSHKPTDVDPMKAVADHVDELLPALGETRKLTRRVVSLLARAARRRAPPA